MEQEQKGERSEVQPVRIRIDGSEIISEQKKNPEQPEVISTDKETSLPNPNEQDLAAKAETSENNSPSLVDKITDTITGWSNIVAAQWGDQETFRFFFNRITSKVQPDYSPTEAELEGYEEFPELKEARSPEMLENMKGTADSLRYWRMVKEDHGAIANFFAGFLDPLSVASGVVGGYLVKGATMLGKLKLAKAGANVAKIEKEVSPLMQKVASGVAGGAVSGTIDFNVRYWEHERNANEQIVNSVTAGVIGGMITVGSETVRNVLQSKQAKAFRKGIREMCAKTSETMIGRSDTGNADNWFGEILGRPIPSEQLADNPFPAVKEISSKLIDVAFDRYDVKTGKLVTGEPTVESLMIASKTLAHKRCTDALKSGLEEFEKESPQFNWLQKKNKDWKMYTDGQSMLNAFNEEVHKAFLSPDSSSYESANRVAREFQNVSEELATQLLNIPNGAWSEDVKAAKGVLNSYVKEAEKDIRKIEKKEKNLEYEVQQIVKKEASQIKSVRERIFDAMNDRFENRLDKIDAAKENGGVPEKVIVEKSKELLAAEKKLRAEDAISDIVKKAFMENTDSLAVRQQKRIIGEFVSLDIKKKQLLTILENRQEKLNAFIRKEQLGQLTPKDVFDSEDACYLHRIYKPELIKANEDNFAFCVASGEMSIDKKLSLEDALKIGQEVKQTILEKGLKINDTPLEAGKRGALKGRTLRFATSYIDDFISHDHATIMRDIIETMVPQIELGKKGLTSFENDIMPMLRENREAVLKEFKGDEKATEFLQKEWERGVNLLARMHSRILGTAIKPSSQVMQIITNITTAQRLGMTALTPFYDAMTTTMHNGFGRFFKALYGRFKYDKFNLSKSEMDAVVCAIDENELRRFTDFSTVLDDQWKITRWTANLADYICRPMMMLDKQVKSINGYATEHLVLTLSKAVKEKGISLLPIEDQRILARLNLNEKSAYAIADMFEKHGTIPEKGILRANTEQWEDKQAVDAFHSAVVKRRNETTVTPTIGASPKMYDSQWGRFFGQFKRCMFAAYDKAALPFVQRVQNKEWSIVIPTVAAMVGSSLFKEELYDLITERRRDFDVKVSKALSGVDLLTYGAWVYDTAEHMNFDNSWMNAVSTISGAAPGFGIIKDAILTGSFFQKLVFGKRINRAELHSTRSMIPFQNYLFFTSAFDAFEKSIGQDLLISSYFPEDVRPSIKSFVAKEAKKKKKQKLEAAAMLHLGEKEKQERDEQWRKARRVNVTPKKKKSQKGTKGLKVSARRPRFLQTEKAQDNE